MKRIFVSQSTLELGRNRNQRTLDAKLDNAGKCFYNDYCNVKIVRGIETCYLPDTQNCQTFKFFEKYNGK